MTMERWDAVVIGAGVIGSAVSYFLAGAGLRVCLLDRGAVAAGTSSASAGHTSVQGRVPGPALDLALANIRLLEELSHVLKTDVEYVRAGGLILAEDETEYRLLKEFAARQSAHVPVEFWEAADVRRAEPHLNPRHIVGGTYCPLDGYANPMAVALALSRAAAERGAQVRPHTEVIGVETAEGQVKGVRTATETLWSPTVVNAAGVWSPAIGRLAGVEVGVTPRKGQLLVSEPLPPMVRAVISHAGHIPFKEHGLDTPPDFEGELQKKRYLKQTRSGGFQGRFYVGSTSEFVGFDRGSTWDGVTQLCRYAIDTVPALARARLVRAWAGLRPRSLDGRFIIGPAPALSGFWLATGHDSIGILYSTMTGKLLASYITSGQRPDLLAPFDPARPSLSRSDGSRGEL
jgi:glycine/D-amino acid oxidase-like deaminating enzyme